MFEEIAQKLQRNNEKILSQWLKIIKGRLNLEKEDIFPTEDFSNIVLSLLEGVALVVKNKGEVKVFEKGGEVYDKARELGELRQSQGFRVDQVVSEYLLLKDALWGFCSQEFSPAEVDLRELVERINLSLDKILMTTVETYVENYSKTLQVLAITDPLTRVKNQCFFLEELKLETERSRRYGKPLSLLLIDLDYFHLYNQTFGHLQGDEILKIYASVIQDNCRASDVLARFGGDEFGSILPSTSKVAAERLGLRLKEKIERLRISPVIEKKPYRMTISVGLATTPDDAKTAEELIDQADEALYQAKKRGGNSLVAYQAKEVY